jgi:hypothetical protein
MLFAVQSQVFTLKFENGARLCTSVFPEASQLREHAAAEGDNIWLLTTS